jgi:hypothetical protein
MRSLRHFFRIASLILIINFGVLGAVRGGSGVAPLRFKQLLTYADGSDCEMPCILGIRPGRMNMVQAKVALRTHPFVGRLDENECNQYIGYCAFRLRGIHASGMISAQIDGIVQNVYILMDDPTAMRLGDFINTLGTPLAVVPRFSCCQVDQFISQLTRFPPPYGFRFYFPKQGILVRDNTHLEKGVYRLSPESPVFDFLVAEPTALQNMVGRRDEPANVWEQWHGFTTVDRYFELALAAQ